MTISNLANSRPRSVNNFNCLFVKLMLALPQFSQSSDIKTFYETGTILQQFRPTLLTIFSSLFLGLNRSSTKADPSFIYTGFTDWKHALQSLQQHSTSACHRDAVDCLHLQSSRSRVDQLLDKQNLVQQEINRRNLYEVVDALRLLCVQNIAIRGMQF